MLNRVTLESTMRATTERRPTASRATEARHGDNSAISAERQTLAKHRRPAVSLLTVVVAALLAYAIFLSIWFAFFQD